MKVSWKWKIKIIHNVRNFLTHIQREWEKERGRESSPSGMCDLWPVTDEWLRNSSSLEHDSDSWEDMTCKKKSFGLNMYLSFVSSFIFISCFLSYQRTQRRTNHSGMGDQMIMKSQSLADIPVDVLETGPKLTVLHQQFFLFIFIHCHQVLVHILLSGSNRTHS